MTLKAKLSVTCGVCEHTQTMVEGYAPQQVAMMIETRCPECKRAMRVHSNREDKPGMALWNTTTETLVMGKWRWSGAWSAIIPRSNNEE